MLPYVRKYLRTKVRKYLRRYFPKVLSESTFESTKVRESTLFRTKVRKYFRKYFRTSEVRVLSYEGTSVHTLSICLRSVNKRRAHSEYCSGRGVSKPTTCSVCSSVHRQCRSQCGNLIEVGDYKFSIDGRDSDAFSTESRCKTSLFPRFENNMLHSAFCI